MDTLPAPSLDATVQRAHRAFEAAAAASPQTRWAWMEALADALDAHADDLVERGHRETHLPVARLRVELTRTAFQLRLLGEEAKQGTPLNATIDHTDPSWPMGPRPDIRRVAQPLGVIGVFGASNFPFAFGVLGGDTASALAAGCAVVHKAHSAHPELARETARIAKDALLAAGAPAGLFDLVEGRDAGNELVRHPLVRAIGFTGSVQGGLALAGLAAARPEPIPFYGELGSTNPVFVTAAAWDSRRDAILSGYVGSVTLGMGQFCTKPGFLVAPRSDRDELVVDLVKSTTTPPHPMLTENLRAGFESARDEFAQFEGADVVATLSAGEGFPSATVFRIDAEAVIRNPELIEHEMFGPASVIIEYDSNAQRDAIAANIGGQLTAGIHAEEGEDISDLVRILSAQSGRVLWNSWPTGVTVSFSQQHGGPFPATTAPMSTSVGTAAISRFLRPVAYQDVPDAILPDALKDGNPWGIVRRVDGQPVR